MTLIGGARAAAEDRQAFTAARHAAFRSSELALGVDSDAELQNLMLLEQAYAANAKVIEAVDGLLQRLLEM
ncbi:flagellar basal body rod C-terminal domain-containing protein [Wenxinia saemankumensis]|uniref:flagellar basal body rod C-terminal domain-containing protein n=1 Tax=Wenxinia saemankumensis TaxID=1447782 RepID=UPI00147C205F|nr:flagellar basal body rod C-terminal domain-containing protein [Wenxinia saemankumensis]